MTVASARVLVVEDAEVIRVAVETGLRAAGYAVLSKPDGRTLERDLTVVRPDVVVDVMLPGRDGFALLELVRRPSMAGW
jgi:two-component system OmpR family response regulator